MLLRLLAAAVALLSLTTAASSAEIKVLTAGAMRAVIAEIAPAFEKATGHTIVLQNDTAGGLRRRIAGGEAFDVAVITPAIVDELAGSGKIASGSRRDVAKVGIGVAIKVGAPTPDLGSADAFKRLLLAARSVAYIDPKAGGSSGIYFDALIDRLGIGEAVRAKAKLKAGGYVAELVAGGEAEIAVHQISEILPVKGVVLAGPLPAEVQNYTIYAAGLATGAGEGSRALVDTLLGADAAAVLKSKGMERP